MQDAPPSAERTSMQNGRASFEAVSDLSTTPKRHWPLAGSIVGRCTTSI